MPESSGGRRPDRARIALAGAHETGKTTLAAALTVALPGHRVIEEPYHAMEAEGHQFSDPPTVADFEDQLRRSIDDLATAPEAAILDRSPVAVAAGSAPPLRRAVDRLLRAGLVDQEWGLAVPVLEVSGSTSARVEQVVTRLRSAASQGVSTA